ncbi:B12-binding domain-containing radical SAM protein [Archaeoglobus sp.]
MRYEEPVFRPPSEAFSLIIQATIGCSWNKCTFCGMYKMKKFRVRDIEEVKEDFRLAKEIYGNVRRVFLADGNALTADTDYLLDIAEYVNRLFNLERISCYATPQDILEKSKEELKKIRNAGIKLLYVGIESGDDEILEKIRKGVTSDEIAEACNKAHECGFDLSVTVLTGIGGKERSYENARNTARLLNRISPKYTGVLTYIPVPNTPLYVKIKRGEFLLPNALENLLELRWMVERLEAKTIFRCNHASNYLPLKGTLPEDREKLLKAIDYAIAHPEVLKPEWLRGL